MGRSRPPAPPPMQELPKKEEILDIIDEVSGTQIVTVTGADGKKKRVISRLPRTKEEDEFLKQAEELIASSMYNLKQLYAKDPTSVIDFKPIIDTFSSINEDRAKDLATIANLGNIEQDVQDFRSMQESVLNYEWDIANRRAEQGLVDRGISDSSTGNDLRARMMREEALTRQQADIQARMYGEGLADQRLNRNIAAFGLREQGRAGQLQEAEAAYNYAQQQKADLEALKQSQIDQELQKLQIGQGIKNNDTNLKMQSNAPQIALGEYTASSQDAMNRYNSKVNATQADYQNRLAAYNSRPPSMMQSLSNLAMTAGGAYAGWALGGGAGLERLKSGLMGAGIGSQASNAFRR